MPRESRTSSRTTSASDQQQLQQQQQVQQKQGQQLQHNQLGPPPHLDLSVIDHAFGDFADLYSDVLRVSVMATHEQIQLAYFDRRSELFSLLAKLDSQPQDHDTLALRNEAERKMDSVVLAVRILGDPSQRLLYDRIRQERLLNRRRAEHGQLPGHTLRHKNHKQRVGLDSVHPHHHHHPEHSTHGPVGEPSSKSKHGRTTFANTTNTNKTNTTKSMTTNTTPTNQSKIRQKSKKSTRGSSGRDKERYNVHPESPSSPEPVEDEIVMNRSKETQDTEQETDEESDLDLRNRSTSDEMRQDDTFEGSTTYTVEERKKQKERAVEESNGGMLSCITNSRILRKISDEISGACEDTLVSVDQVFNAFTLTDKDIRAVTKRIDKAKRQLEH